jgi:SRSO17 transposase
MIGRASAAGVSFDWVAADSVYGVGDVEMVLRHAAKSYVRGVNATHHLEYWVGKPAVAGTAEDIAKDIDPAA